jgi:hypothetical protein
MDCCRLSAMHSQTGYRRYPRLDERLVCHVSARWPARLLLRR